MFIQSGNARLYTVEFGSGPRTILAHGGWTGNWELWAEPFIHLSRKWRTVAYDHRGCGATVAPVESITMESMVSDVFAVMDELQVEKCVLAAESAGGMVAVETVLQQPGRFSGLVLVDALLHNEVESNIDFIRGLRANYEQTCARFVDACVLESEENSAENRIWGRKILNRATVEAAVRLIEYSHGLDQRPRLSQVRVPTLIIHGGQDAIVPLGDSEYAASQIPLNKLHVIKGTGHVPSITRPREVAEEIERFFEGK